MKSVKEILSSLRSCQIVEIVSIADQKRATYVQNSLSRYLRGCLDMRPADSLTSMERFYIIFCLSQALVSIQW